MHAYCVFLTPETALGQSTERFDAISFALTKPGASDRTSRRYKLTECRGLKVRVIVGFQGFSATILWGIIVL